MKKHARIYIGTSGWHYGHWKGPFYPEALSDGALLDYYLCFFHTVEINNTFYRMPEKEILLEWKKTAPEDFIFAVKASRYITHMKKLKECKGPVVSFLKKIALLGDRLGPVLFQLPPHWNINPGRLNAFLKLLSKDFRYAFEFRDTSWFSTETYDALAEHGAAFCIYDLDRNLSPKAITADFVYIRLHGTDGPYRGKYSTKALSGWAGAFSAWARQGREIYCYFDNDEKGYAAQDALRLQEMTNKAG